MPPLATLVCISVTGEASGWAQPEVNGVKVGRVHLCAAGDSLDPLFTWCSHITARRKEYSIKKKLKQLDKVLGWDFRKEAMWVGGIHIIIWERWEKLSPFVYRWPKCNRLTLPSADKDTEPLEHSYVVGGNATRRFGSRLAVSYQLKQTLTLWVVTKYSLRYLPKRNENLSLHKNSCTNVHRSFIQSGPK